MVLCVGLGAYTSVKLLRMTQVGDEQTSRVVFDKSSRPVGQGKLCELWWNDRGDRTPADCDYWETVKIGDTVEIVTVDGKPYVKGGDAGNLTFDIVLLGAEILGFLTCLVLLLLRRRKR
jgi:hypothetical protein